MRIGIRGSLTNGATATSVPVYSLDYLLISQSLIKEPKLAETIGSAACSVSKKRLFQAQI